MTGATLDAQLKNWDNFCRYHALGDWHGIWTRYSPTGEVIESLQCIRSLRASADSSEVEHQNHYIYPDGTSETKTFGPYQKPATRSLFLGNSFSWGSTKLESGFPFGFETGFTNESRRVSIGVLYDRTAKLEKITIIAEHLGSFATETISLGNSEKMNWQGICHAIAPNLEALLETSAAWREIEDLEEGYLTINQQQDGISVSCPRQIESRENFVLVVDWQVNSTLLHRGIRHFKSFEFTQFSLENFTLAE